MMIITSTSKRFWLLPLVANVLLKVVHATPIRDPTYQDYEELEQIIADWAELTTCPDTNDPLNPHWDWDDATGDCRYWPRTRSPRPLLTRLVRHAFHDALGEMDGFIDLTNPEHNGLESSMIILDDIHATGQFPSTGEPIKDALNKADLVAWACIAAVRLTAMRQTGNGGLDDTDHVPTFDLRFGRKTYDAVVDGPHPIEQFPVNGPGGTAADIETYFATNFAFTPAEAVTIMGAHTLGGARPPESGYTGRWTSDKNTFDNLFYTSMMSPVAIGENNQILDSPTLCEEDVGGGRCLGWEQIRRTDPNTGGNKFQWRHSCRDSSSVPRGTPLGCTHLMLNVDIAFFRDIDDYLCTDAKVAEGACVQADHGKIIGFPNPNPGNCVWGVDRILATCFFERFESRDYVQAHADNQNNFIDEFAVLFDKMISSTRNPVGWPELSVVPPPEPEVPRGSPCPQSCLDEHDGFTNPWFCGTCATDLCGIDAAGDALCRGNNFVAPPDGLANGEACPTNTGDCDPTDTLANGTPNPFPCAGCASQNCAWTQRPSGADRFTCRGANFTP